MKRMVTMQHMSCMIGKWFGMSPKRAGKKGERTRRKTNNSNKNHQMCTVLRVCGMWVNVIWMRHGCCKNLHKSFSDLVFHFDKKLLHDDDITSFAVQLCWSTYRLPRSGFFLLLRLFVVIFHVAMLSQENSFEVYTEHVSPPHEILMHIPTHWIDMCSRPFINGSTA